MNQHLFNVKKSSLVIASLLLGNSVAMAEGLQINWLDSSNNEDGFNVEKRLLESDAFEVISSLPANANTYTDSNVIVNETYCYRVVAYNPAGQSPSDESCMVMSETAGSVTDEEVTTPEQSTPPEQPNTENPTYSFANVAISHEFINKPSVIEIGEKELYSFNSNEVYNESYSSDGIYNVEFSTDKGKVSHYDRDYFSFHQDGNELVNGFAMMGFNTGNNLSFDLQSNGTAQTATLYMQAGVWSREVSNVIVTVGDQVENIALPRGYAWHYFSVDIQFDGTAPVTITTDSDRDGYSSVMFAGIVLNEAVSESEPEAEEVIEAVKYASMLSVDTTSSTTIDVTNIKFITHEIEIGNADLSEATLEQLSFYGTTKSSDQRYKFIDDNGSNYSGFQGMGWKEENGVNIKLQSGDSQVNTVSLYFTAGAWTRDTAMIEVIFNGKSELIELSSGFAWKHKKVDIEFEGELEIEIRPVGNLGGYSYLMFAGLTLN